MMGDKRSMRRGGEAPCYNFNGERDDNNGRYNQVKVLKDGCPDPYSDSTPSPYASNNTSSLWKPP